MRRRAIIVLILLAGLVVGSIPATGAGPTSGAGVIRIQAEETDVRTVGGRDGPGWNLWSNGHLQHPVDFETGDAGDRHQVVVRARANSSTWRQPIMELRIDGQSHGRQEVVVESGWGFRSYHFDVTVEPGLHDVAVAFVNDTNHPDRNLDLIIDWFEVRTPPGEADPPGTSVPGGNPGPPSTETESPPISVSVPPPPDGTKPDSPAPTVTTPEDDAPSTSTTTTEATSTTTTEPPATRPTTPIRPTTTARPTTTSQQTTTTRATSTAPARNPSGGRSAHIPAGYQLTWNDEFDSLSLDLAGDGGENWAPWWVDWNVLSLAGNGDQCMKAYPDYTGTGGPRLGLETHRVQNGVLTLFGRPIPQNRRGQFWGYEAACGMISGEKSHSQLHGYWETRMRIPNVSQGHHWAIWLLPADDRWPPEVDILEVVGDAPGRDTDERRFHFTGHYPTAGGKDADMAYQNAPRAADDWYVLGLEWTPDAVIWYLDGVEVHRMWDFIGPHPSYFLISPEIGGNWPGPTGPGTEWPMAMEIDYVRIYQR